MRHTFWLSGRGRACGLGNWSETAVEHNRNADADPALHLKVIKLDWVKGVTDFLISNLGFFFVPSGVALMLYFELIKAEILPIAVSTFVSTALVLVCTGATHQYLRKKKNKTDEKGQEK